MKIKKLLLSAFASTMIVASVTETQAQARVQIIHNSADAAAAVVDVWLNNTVLIADNFAFRTATPFINAPAGIPFTVEIKGPDSDVASPAVATFNFTLENEETYIIVANGIVSASGYNPATPFNLHVYNMGREEASSAGNTDVLVFHGATDAPRVDVAEVNIPAGLIVDDLNYSEFQGYLELPTLDFNLQIRDQSNSISIVEFAAPLQTLGLQGAALTVLASGFLDPSQNANGPAFGLWVALPAGGPLVELPSVAFTPAKVQIIHNSADAAAAIVDVYLNGAIAIDNFEFRNATPFIDFPVPAFGSTNIIRVCPPNSTDDSNPVAEFELLNTTDTYVVIVNGIASPSGYNPSPALSLDAFRGARESSDEANNADVLVFHGSTDAGPVAVNEATAGVVIPEFTYTDFAGYVPLNAEQNYVFQIRDVAQTTTIISYTAPINSLNLGGAAITVLASGFLNPANNSDGAGFGLWVATANGGPLLALPVFTEPEQVQVQIIHNSADAAAALVDIWVGNTKAFDNVAFRSATPFVELPANTDLEVRISPSTSMDTTGAIKKFDVNLEAGQNYIVVANGIASPSGYNPAPPLELHVLVGAKTEAASANETEIVVYHGSTDAPTVDIYDATIFPANVFDDVSYSEFTDYVALPVLNYIIQVRDETGTAVVAAYQAPLETLGLGGEAITVLASGFLNPANNSNGASFGLWVALAAGGALVELPISTSIEKTETASFNVYPNPSNEISYVEFNNDKSADLTIRLTNLDGKVIYTNYLGNRVGFNRVELNTANLSAGIYFIELINDGISSVNKLIVTH